MSNNTNTEKYQKCLNDIGILLQRTSTLFQMIEREQKRQTGYTSSQSFLLTMLLEEEELSMGEIGKIMNLEKSSVSRMVAILVREKLLSQKSGPEDKRQILVNLTPQGTEEGLKIKKVREEYFSQIIAHLPSGHVREVMGSAEILFSALEKAI